MTSPLPHWDLTTVYPGLDSIEFVKSHETFSQTVADLTKFFDNHAIMLPETSPPLDAETVTLFETVVTKINTIMERTQTLSTYVMSFVTTDSRDEKAQARMSELMMQRMQLSKLNTRFTAWLGSLNVEALIEMSHIARDHAYALREASIEAQHLMSPVEETLAAELNLTGGSAWAKLYNNFSSQITHQVEIEGEVKTLPMTTIRNLAFEADRGLRKRAYEAELAAWDASSLPIASAMNSIKGQMNTLSARRGWDTPLDVALFNNRIDRETLNMMMDTAREFFPDFRRYLNAKARLLGLNKLTWYDLFAPVGEIKREWTFDTSRDFIVEEFSAFSPKLGAMAARAFAEHWIDVEPRDGKRGGAFCAWLRDDESRILANFKPAYSGMSTLAHELGHAYHNLARAGRTFIQRQTPMTLAETASNFCEIVVREAALKTASTSEQIAILEASLQDATQVIVDITSRYLFEMEVFERRQKRELSAEELNAIMLESQRATYGDGLDEEALHPYMWAVKPHYYGSTFYNFPYMFGLLFSLGLYAHYQHSPEEFLAKYDLLLSTTGMDDAATLATRFDINVRSPDFWRSSLTLIVEDVQRFEALVDAQ